MLPAFDRRFSMKFESSRGLWDRSARDLNDIHDLLSYSVICRRGDPGPILNSTVELLLQILAWPVPHLPSVNHYQVHWYFYERMMVLTWCILRPDCIQAEYLAYEAIFLSQTRLNDWPRKLQCEIINELCPPPNSNRRIYNVYNVVLTCTARSFVRRLRLLIRKYSKLD